MSSPPSEPENAAPTSPVRSGQGQRNSPSGGQNKPTRWTQTSRTSSTSLLTRALAGNQEAEESPPPSSASRHSPKSAITPVAQYFAASKGQSNNGVNNGRDKGKTLATVATGPIQGLRTSRDLRSAPSTPPLSSIQYDMEHVDSRLVNYRDFLNGNRGRGISLERTDKEKRAQDSPKGTYSTNPGDTALPPSPVTVSPTALDTISNNHPTEGIRAKYRSWREPRSSTGPEKAWSIGEDGADDILGGQVEKSIKDAMAGVEPNNRSRKASHSLRFFKEGLPDDKTKKRESKSRGRSKDGSVLAKTSPVSEHPKLRTPQAKSDSTAAHERPADGQSPASSPRGSKTPAIRVASGQARFSPISASASVGSPSEGYFDAGHTADTLSEEQVNTLPAALLDEIRKHHNLTPGAAKGSSFSRSIPVTESERQKPTDDNQASKSVEDDQQHYNGDSDGDKPSHVRGSEEDEESSEEQISSALFVPHKTPHDSPERERDGMRSVQSPVLDSQDQLQTSTSQEWLEEYEVPSRDLDKKYTIQEPKPRPSPSPTRVKQPSLHPDKEKISSEPQALSDVDPGMTSEGGYSTAGEESSVADDHELTPTGSVKQDISSSYAQHIHDHQQVPRQPLEAIELIPYRHQVGGHTTMWRFSKRAVCKQLNNRENEFYEKVEHYHPQLLKFLPRYIGVLNVTLEKQIRRRPTRKDLATDAANETQDPAKGTEADGSTNLATQSSANSHGISDGTDAEQVRVISQSLSSGPVPIPTVTFADNRHIIPKSFMQSHPHSADLQHQSMSDSASPANLRSGTNLNRPPIANGNVKYRPTLSDKHAVSWGATTVNKQLRNQVFNEAFLDQPIPIQAHKKPANQKRPLPARHGPSNLRTSNSESSLKTAQQSQLASATQPTELSIRRKAMRAAAEQRNGLTPLTTTDSVSTFDEGIATDEEEEKRFGEKAGTSAPESDTVRSVKGKRQRRYSSGGLRRKPVEVQDDRGNLKYFEEADDVGYKGDMEEDLFSMDPEPSEGTASLATTADRDGSTPALHDGDIVVGPEASNVSGEGTMLPAGTSEPTEPSNLLDIHRPVNPKEAQTQRDSRVEYFLLLEDLTTGMKRPCIMDLKMGTRQYGVNADEKKQESQRRKCADTTSKELGVRVCGLQVWDAKQQEYIFLDKYFGRDLKIGSPFQDALKRFLYDGVDYSSVLRHIPTILKKLAQLELLIKGLSGYRFYASSLLLFYDGDTKGDDESDSAATGKDIGAKNEIDFKIADFANCITKEDARPGEWQAPPQNPELPDNGFLRGLRSLRRYFIAIQRECKGEVGGEKQNLTNMMESTDEEDGVMSY